ncbi:MAG: hypothetical protein JO053_14995 [Acidobacteria bacterium]|nr:hypothetical protein [Acidobacteriota bacterium]
MRALPLYTFFLEYRGGTYIAQVRARSFRSAPAVWAKSFEFPDAESESKYFEPKFKEKLIESVDLDMPTPIDGIRNTWYFSAFRLDNCATIHFTQTAG